MYINVIDSVSMAVYVYQSEIQAARRGASNTTTGLTAATEDKSMAKAEPRSITRRALVAAHGL